MPIERYLNDIRNIYKSGQSTEHSFRPALVQLFSQLGTDITVINEAQRIEGCMPDLTFRRGELSIGWCEAKDIDKDLNSFAKSGANRAQKEKYIKAFPNLIYTNGIDFEFILNGERVDFISIATFKPNLPALSANFSAFSNRIHDFFAEPVTTVQTPQALAQLMASKTAIIRDIVQHALQHDLQAFQKNEETPDPEFQPSELLAQYFNFQKQLIAELTPEEFADVYAETVAYGLFAARLHDKTPEDFSRSEARDLLPKTNILLHTLFDSIAKADFDSRLSGMIDQLCEIFRATNMEQVLEKFGKNDNRDDPFLHFYEDFLAAYNPEKRKSRGVWYTPQAVVQFIVRAVDQILQDDFEIDQGLADTEKITIDWDTGQNTNKGKAATNKKTVHRVQVLDPATGTGTFLAEVLNLIAERIQQSLPAAWSNYVEKDLLPRLHGLELLMASYAMCHLKLGKMLDNLNYQPSAKAPRLSVFLNNTLEESERVQMDLFDALGLQRALMQENLGANNIKRQWPVMCILGNPPYAGHSSNNGEWIMKLMQDYKKEPNSKQKLQERNPKWLNDDYVKFIRFSEHMIEKNGEGVMALITNHGYLDNPTFRGMRWHLLQTFDRIHIIDLHGNSKKKEVDPNGNVDKNVFDIMQGVAIIIAIKRKNVRRKSKSLAEVWHGDLWGARESKYQQLRNNDLETLSPNLITPQAPQFDFVPRDFADKAHYDQGFSLVALMPENSVGIVTARDHFCVDMDKNAVWARVKDLKDGDIETLRQKYQLGKDSQEWSVNNAQNDVKEHFDESNLTKIAYRPFDTRWTYFTGKSKGFHCRTRSKIMRHFVNRENLGLIIGRQGQAVGSMAWNVVFCVDAVCDLNIFYRGGGMTFPLYLYPEDATDEHMVVNFDRDIYQKLAQTLGWN